jgi:DnaJ family protein C protein 19
MDMHTFALRRDDQRDNNSSVNHHFHTSAPSERAVAIIMGLTCLSAVGYAGSSAAKSYEEWKAAQPSAEEYEAQEKERQEEQATQDEESKKQEKEASKQPRENMFKEWFGVGVGAKYYEGGFEDSMTRREAALILGVRESSSAQRIKDAHRKLLVLNHPDTGGSTYIAGKTNEAKELLLKGKSKAKA